eukprot:scaffold33966_cov143-Skeletonema_menzelii.AAC.3
MRQIYPGRKEHRVGVLPALHAILLNQEEEGSHLRSSLTVRSLRVPLLPNAPDNSPAEPPLYIENVYESLLYRLSVFAHIISVMVGIFASYAKSMREGAFAFCQCWIFVRCS